MSTKKEMQNQAESTTKNKTTSQGFTDEEKAAMKARAKELKAEARASKNKEEAQVHRVTGEAVDARGDHGRSRFRVTLTEFLEKGSQQSLSGWE